MKLLKPLIIGYSTTNSCKLNILIFQRLSCGVFLYPTQFIVRPICSCPHFIFGLKTTQLTTHG